MKKIMILIAMVMAMQVATAETALEGSTHSETEMKQKPVNQTANDTITIYQIDHEQLIRNYGEMPISNSGSSHGQWRGLIVLLKLILIGSAFASRGNSSGNE